MVGASVAFSTATIAAFARRILFVMPRLARANTTVATNEVTLFALSVPSRDRRLFAPPFHDQKFVLVASAPTKCQPPLRKVSAIVPHSLVRGLASHHLSDSQMSGDQSDGCRYRRLCPFRCGMRRQNAKVPRF